MLKFKGIRTPWKEENTVIFSLDNILWANLPLYLDEVNHSPTGFEWGYGGSGPAQLAYAVLRTYFRVIYNDDTQDQARAFYMRFKSDFIAAIKTDEWEIDNVMIGDWLGRIQ